MARGPFSAANYLSHAGAAVTAPPFTFAGWVKLNALAADSTMITVGTDGTENQGWWLYANDLAHGLAFRARNTGNGLAIATVDVSIGQWYHACGIEYASNSRAIITNGGDKTFNSTNVAPSGMNITQLGALPDETDVLDGLLAEAAIWNVALTDFEVTALASGVPPRRIRPASIVRYWPLWGIDSPERNYAGFDGALTMTGTVPQGFHAPVVSQIAERGALI